MAREADFKQKFQKELKKRVKPVAILQYKQDATTLKGFPRNIVFFVIRGIMAVYYVRKRFSEQSDKMAKI